MKAGWWEAPLTLRDLAEAINLKMQFMVFGRKYSMFQPSHYNKHIKELTDKGNT